MPQPDDWGGSVVKKLTVKRCGLSFEEALNVASCAWRSPAAAWFAEAKALRHGLSCPASTAEGDGAEAIALVAVAMGTRRVDRCEGEGIKGALSYCPLAGAVDEKTALAPLRAKLADESRTDGTWHPFGAG